MRGIGRIGRRGPKALKRRKLCRPWDASEGVSKPWRCSASPAAYFLPDASQGRSLWVIIIKTWYYVAGGSAVALDQSGRKDSTRTPPGMFGLNRLLCQRVA